jgi:hypothetical protein
MMNIYDIDETGVSPFVATFGSHDAVYGKLPETLDIDSAHDFIKALDKDLL